MPASKASLMPASTSARVVVAFSAAARFRAAILALTSSSASSLQALLSTVSGFQRARSGHASSIARRWVLPATRAWQYLSRRGFASGMSLVFSCMRGMIPHVSRQEPA